MGSTSVQARYLYEPFGTIIAMGGPLADRNLYRFSSKEWHGNSVLVYYGYRYYSPGLQRWINRDPIGESSDRNTYRFASSAPVIVVDADGLAAGAPSTLPPVGPPVTIIIQPPPFTMPPGGGAGDVGSIVGPPGNCGSGNNCVITVGMNSCNPPGRQRNQKPTTLTCPCTMLEVQCIEGEVCTPTRWEGPAQGATGTQRPFNIWLPFRKCQRCPEGNYSFGYGI